MGLKALVGVIGRAGKVIADVMRRHRSSVYKFSTVYSHGIEIIKVKKMTEAELSSKIEEFKRKCRN